MGSQLNELTVLSKYMMSNANTQTDILTSSIRTSLRALLDNSWKDFRLPSLGSIATISVSTMKESVSGDCAKMFSTRDITSGYYESHRQQ